MDHDHEYDDATGEPGECPVPGCWFNDAPCDLPDGMVQDALFEGE